MSSTANRYNAVRDIAGDLDSYVRFTSTFGAGKMVVVLDGENWVFVRQGFNVVLVLPNGQKIPLSWMVMTITQGDKHDVQVAGGVIHGGTMEVTMRGVHGVPMVSP